MQIAYRLAFSMDVSDGKDEEMLRAAPFIPFMDGVEMMRILVDTTTTFVVLP